MVFPNLLLLSETEMGFNKNLNVTLIELIREYGIQGPALWKKILMLPLSECIIYSTLTTMVNEM